VRTSGDSAVASKTPVIAALDMGYGHLRAASALAAASGATLVEVDRPPVASPREAAAWLRARRWYERLSRAADAWYAPGARVLLDLVTGIPATTADAEGANLAVRALARSIRDGLGAGLADHLRASGDPLLATFYAPAVAADAHGAERVHLVLTDSDVHRVWVPADARRSRITYLAPTETAAARVRSYGVAPERVRVTGFPLPPGLADDESRRRLFARRIVRLDPTGVFRAARREELRAVLGEVPEGPADPPTIVFAVGGAGAQVDTGRVLLSALREPLARGALRLVLVAGTRPLVAARFERWLGAARLGDAATILFERDFVSYCRRFDETLATADALWTKPSELTFFGALGLPLLLAPPLGVHERRNRAWALELGAAVDASAARRTAVRLASLVADGTLAQVAWNGFRRMPHDGTWRILEAVAAS
jgi:hypothetical protein